VRVKNEREVTGSHCRFQNDDCRFGDGRPPNSNLKSEI
jgi:hypothetical protein